MLCDVSKEHHELISKQLEETKVFLQTQITDIRMLLNSKVKKFDENSTTLHKKVDVEAEASTRLIKDISSLNKSHMVGLQDKKKGDDQVYTSVEEFLIEIKTLISEESTISLESLSQMVSNIKLNIKMELASMYTYLI
ncbi:unnamed protein product [Lactuca virosa]|uniref:Uncharacterized protein n=1 Tax=Lactuca virosa TaxID=75947 RepID=A0AAU9PJ51_9ASTR|nr:unnamed protein product [Lactuca virosa]